MLSILFEVRAMRSNVRFSNETNELPFDATGLDTLASDARYEVRVARDVTEITAALRLRYEVFTVELGASTAADSGNLEFDIFDFRCKHLVAVDRRTKKTVGTYRLNSIESAGGLTGFYSYGEFGIEVLPGEILENGVEIGRACIAREHRNSKVLFLMWKALSQYLLNTNKRYFFGCCSIFTRDPAVGANAYRQLSTLGLVAKEFVVPPRANALDLDGEFEPLPITFPALFEMYLRLGAKVCGPPVIDAEFGSIDFFVVFDIELMNERYRKMFFGRDVSNNSAAGK
jgi:putative hemolysin